MIHSVTNSVRNAEVLSVLDSPQINVSGSYSSLVDNSGDFDSMLRHEANQTQSINEENEDAPDRERQRPERY